MGAAPPSLREIGLLQSEVEPARSQDPHSELPAFGIGGSREIAGCRHHCSGGWCGAKRSNRAEELAAMTDRGDADADQVVGRQLRQHIAINIVVAESGGYRSSPSPRSHATTSMGDPRLRGAAAPHERGYSSAFRLASGSA